MSEVGLLDERMDHVCFRKRDTLAGTSRRQSTNASVLISGLASGMPSKSLASRQHARTSGIYEGVADTNVQLFFTCVYGEMEQVSRLRPTQPGADQRGQHRSNTQRPTWKAVLPRIETKFAIRVGCTKVSMKGSSRSRMRWNHVDRPRPSCWKTIGVT